MWGATPKPNQTKSINQKFQFTHPVWGATDYTLADHETLAFQFTHPVWGATAILLTACNPKQVSIHAPRVGCDRELSTP